MKELLNKREPLIVLKEFRFLNRPYGKGDLFDRRRIKIRNHMVKKFIDNGTLCFAKHMKEKDLGENGWIYDGSKNTRYPLSKLESTKVDTIENFEVNDEVETIDMPGKEDLNEETEKSVNKKPKAKIKNKK